MSLLTRLAVQLPAGRDNVDVVPVSLNGGNTYDFIDLANKLLAYAILLAGLLSVIFMFYGGISFILSGGKEDKVKTAVHTIRYALLGLIVAILSVTVVTIVGKVFNLRLVDYLSFQSVIQTINDLFR